MSEVTYWVPLLSILFLLIWNIMLHRREDNLDQRMDNLMSALGDTFEVVKRLRETVDTLKKSN